MAQLKVSEILAVLKGLKEAGMSEKEIGELPVYIGDDDELNGIHTAYYVQKIDNSPENEEYCELIEENCINAKLKGAAILIS